MSRRKSELPTSFVFLKNGENVNDANTLVQMEMDSFAKKNMKSCKPSRKKSMDRIFGKVPQCSKPKRIVATPTRTQRKSDISFVPSVALSPVKTGVMKVETCQAITRLKPIFDSPPSKSISDCSDYSD